ncbi:ribbon-helix-helix protein, CopG family [Saccharolobus islandicus]|uniref:CopG DNA-binding domain protein n=1 Tax=Saccharolobus islandicus (strain M.16.4 / Kamchatka \|nr:ribbon-helix-helix protein, CopG family [Sulfolobus islandicus]ACR42198.1 CopG DNA-binding domain protein [Sulfolobus islandicus M.16.4]
MRVITFKLEEELLQELDLYAINRKMCRSEIIREAIKLYLSIKKSSTLIEENYQNKEIKVQEL